jgi:hypothetical protein
MRKATFFLSILVLVFACSKNPDNTDPIIEGDFITEINTYAIGDENASEKIILENDGERYVSYKRYWNTGPNESLELITVGKFTYDANGFLILAEMFSEEGQNTPSRKFEYEWNGDSYSVKNSGFIDGQFSVDYDYSLIYFENPEDGYRMFTDLIWSFKNGNLVGQGYESETDGTVEAFGKKWVVRESSIFDNQPNIYANQAIDFVLGQRDLARSLNMNNFTGLKLPDGRIEQWQTNVLNGKAVSLIFEDARVEFSYVIE